MSYEYKDVFIESLSNFIYPGKIFDDSLSELDHVYSQASKADEYEANLNEVKRQLKIKIRHARRDGDYSEAYAFSEALDMIGDLI